MGTGGAELGAALLADAKRQLVVKSAPRICKCLDLLTEEEIWEHPNDETVSVGNLVLHLCGNVRQWLISGLGGEPDHRDRDSEFAERGHIPRADLVRRLEKTLDDAAATLDKVDPESLLAPRRVQGQDETGLSIVTHVVEHFSYHAGQIALAVKMRKAVDLKYYEGADLNAKNE